MGMVASAVLVMIVQAVGSSLFPLPEGFDPMAPDPLRLPFAVVAVVAVAWSLGPLLGGLVSTLVAGSSSPVPAFIVGILLLAADVANLVAIPSPVWLWVVGVVAPLPFAWLGFAAALSIVRRRRVEDRS